MTPTVSSQLCPGNPKLLEQVRNVMRVKHYSIRTERCYCDWIVRFIRFHGDCWKVANPLLKSAARNSRGDVSKISRNTSGMSKRL